MVTTTDQQYGQDIFKINQRAIWDFIHWQHIIADDVPSHWLGRPFYDVQELHKYVLEANLRLRNRGQPQIPVPPSRGVAPQTHAQFKHYVQHSHQEAIADAYMGIMLFPGQD